MGAVIGDGATGVGSGSARATSPVDTICVDGEIKFELLLPAEAANVPAGPVEWQVWTTLEIAWSRNLDHAVDVIVTR